MRNAAPDPVEISPGWRRGPPAALAWALRREPRLDAWGRAFAVACGLHLLLPDYDAPGWAGPRALLALGAAALLARPCLGAFALCLAGTLWPLLALRDVLTQSMYLAWGAAAAVLGLARRDPDLTRDAARLLTAGTYLLAAFHKLNRDFFDPAVSCAHHAWAQFAAYWPDLPAVDGAHWLPPLVIAVEVALGALVLLRSPLAWPLGLLFHLPLTLTLAPAFGAVMLSGYVAAVGPRQAVRWRRARPPILAAGAVAAVAACALLHRGLDGPLPLLKVATAGAIGAGALLAAGRPWLSKPRAGPAALAIGAAWVLHGLTPYLGLQFQHTAAMLSNLRVDAGCHNSLVMPESLRLLDPYVRVDEASVGAGRPEREQILRETLWNLTALGVMRRNWCVPENRPLRLAGTWRGRPFAIADLCAEGWDAPFDAPFGAGFLPGFQALQKNLPRRCPAACIH